MGNKATRESPMLVFDPLSIFALSAFLTSISTLIWSLRRKP